MNELIGFLLLLKNSVEANFGEDLGVLYKSLKDAMYTRIRGKESMYQIGLSL